MAVDMVEDRKGFCWCLLPAPTQDLLWPDKRYCGPCEAAYWRTAPIGAVLRWKPDRGCEWTKSHRATTCRIQLAPYPTPTYQTADLFAPEWSPLLRGAALSQRLSGWPWTLYMPMHKPSKALFFIAPNKTSLHRTAHKTRATDPVSVCST